MSQVQSDKNEDRKRVLDVFLRWNRRWLPLIVSICALAFTIQQGYETREHDRASLSPYFYVERTVGPKEFGWTIDNNGLGPALLEGLGVFVDGKPQGTWEDLSKALDLPATFGGDSRTPSFGSSSSIASIGPGKPFLLYRAWSEDDADANLERFHKWADRVRLEGCICSVYSDCWKFTSERGRTEVQEGCAAGANSPASSRQ